MGIFVDFGVFYEFEGWRFEWNRNQPYGPWPCKKDLEPRKRAGRKFYEMFSRFQDLTHDQQEAHRIK